MNTQTALQVRNGQAGLNRRGFLALAGTATALGAGGVAWSGAPAHASSAHSGSR